MAGINLEKLKNLQKDMDKKWKKEREDRKRMYKKHWKEWEQDRWQQQVDIAEQQEADRLKATQEGEHEEDKLQIFNFVDKHEVRTVMKDGNPWFVAKDVCDILGIRNARDTLAKVLDDDEKGVDTIYTLGGKQVVNTVSESGLYTLITKSIKPEAKIFRGWVSHEVLPSIRKHGAYLTPEKIKEIVNNPELLESLTPALNQALAEKVERDAPKVQLADLIIDSDATISISVLAKILAKNGIDIGPIRLFEWMRRKGYLIKQKGRNWNVPKQEHIKSGILTTKVSVVKMPEGGTMEVPTPLVTGKGQAYFINKFLRGHEGTVF